MVAAGLVAYGRREAAVGIASGVLTAMDRFGGPVELYCVDSADVLVDPSARPAQRDGEILFARRRPPHPVQAFSAAAQIHFLALLRAGRR